MDTGSIFGFMDMIVLGCGAYGFYTYYMLVKKGEVKKTFLMGQNTDIKNCKDLQGFINFMSTKVLILSIGLVIYGGAALYNDFTGGIGAILAVVMVAFFAILVWYCIQLKKSTDLFFK